MPVLRSQTGVSSVHTSFSSYALKSLKFQEQRHLEVVATNSLIGNGLPLPKELRDIIYELTVGLEKWYVRPAIYLPPKSPPKYYTGKRKPTRRGKKIANRRACEQKKKMYPTQLAVLALTCKQFRDDLKAPLFMYHERTFHFGNPQTPMKYFKSIGQPRMNLIGSLDLYISYYWFTALTKPCNKLFRALETCEGLKKLRLDVFLDLNDGEDDPYLVGGTRHISWAQFSLDLFEGLKNLKRLDSFELAVQESCFCCPDCLHCVKKYWGLDMRGDEIDILVNQIKQ